MAGFLRQATAAQSRALGPFIDETDFITPLTGLTIANTDIKLVTNGGASANKNSGGGTHRANGVYGVTFDATDTATVGEIEVSVLVSPSLLVWDKFVVLEETVYDALLAAAAAGYLQSTVAGRLLDVSAGGNAGIDWANIEAPTTAVNLSATNIDVDQVVASVTGAVGSVTGAVGSVAAGGITAASIATDAIDADAMADGAITAATFAAGAITATVIATGAIDADAIADNAIDAGAIAADAITAGKIADGAIDAATFAAGAITATVIANGAIDAATFAAGAIDAAAIADGAIDAATFAAGAITAAAIATDAIDNDAIAATAVTEIQAGLATAASIAALNNLSAAQVNTEVDTALADIHLDHLLAVTYDPASKPGVADALLNELVESDGGVARYTANALEQAPTGGSAPTVGEIADAVWDEATAGHTTSGTFGEQLKTDVDAILVDTAEIGAAGAGLTAINLPDQAMNIVGNITGNLSGSVGSVTGAVGSVTAGVTLANDAITAAKFDESTAFPLTQADTGSSAVARVGADGDTLETLSDQLDTKASQASVDDLPTNAELTAAFAAADDAVLAAIAALNNLSAAQVNAQVVDALAVDTYAELGAVPPATSTLADKLNWLFALGRNTVTQTSTTQSLKNDAESGDIATAAVSDDGTTFERSEWA